MMHGTRTPREARVIPPPPRYPQRNALTPWLIRIPLLGMTAVLLLIFIAAIYVALLQVQYDRLIYPGVSAYGVDLSGMTQEQAIAALSANYTYGDQAVFTFRDGERAWQKSAKELGVVFDARKTVELAYQVGRGEGLINNLLAQGDAWINGRTVQPTVVFDESLAKAMLDQIGAEINRPVLDATLMLRGTTVSATASQVGRQLDTGATLNLVRQVILNLTTGAEIPLVIKETQPVLVNVDEATARLRAAVSSPIKLFIEAATTSDPGPWQATPDFIAGLLSVTRIDNPDGSAHYEVGVNVDPMRAFLNQMASELVVTPQSARFVFNEQTREFEVIKESVDGRELDIEATASAFEAAIFRTENRIVPLHFNLITPTANSTAKARDLGITELVVEATTYFYGSSDERRTNIQVAASKFHGLVIAPNQTFSFNEFLGDVSPETGYETGLVIFGDRTIQGVGGGVCQVSTTIFQAAFFGGYPIVERYAHGYRVGYYESGVTTANGQRFKGGVGMDATVYSPMIDLKFQNDTPHYILMEAYFNPTKQSLTFKFYSTGVGRQVFVEGPTMSNVVPHGPAKYTESTDLRPGQVRQIDYAVDGVDVRVWRTVKAGERILISGEEVYSHYLPWSDQYLVAPGGAPKR